MSEPTELGADVELKTRGAAGFGLHPHTGDNVQVILLDEEMEEIAAALLLVDEDEYFPSIHVWSSLTEMVAQWWSSYACVDGTFALGAEDRHEAEVIATALEAAARRFREALAVAKDDDYDPFAEVADE